MTVSRRKTLALLGGGAILAAGGAGAFAVTRTPQTATLPWAMAGEYTEPRKRALSYAILAPNPHNRQPWMVDLSTPGTVMLYVDTTRLLPHTDPFSRQIVIGLGCFLEQMRMAALEDGYEVTWDLFPDGFDDAALDGRPVATCRFVQTDAPRDPLFAHVMERRSLKEPFDVTKPVGDSALGQILDHVQHTRGGGSVAPEDIAHWRALSNAALRIEIETPRTYRESVDLFRIGWREVDANPDGIDFTGPIFEAMSLTGAFSRESALDTSSIAYREGVNAVLANTDTAMGHVWLVSDGNSRLDQIATGRDWLRVNLACTALGLGFQPLSQALQEYPEMDALYRETHDRLAPGGGTVQMLARIGYGEAVPHSPRWPLETKIQNA